MDKDRKLREIFENDPLGLLNIKPSISPARNEDERLVASFQEINDFYEKNGRPPEQGGGLQEHQLYSRLKSLRENIGKYQYRPIYGFWKSSIAQFRQFFMLLAPCYFKVFFKWFP